MSPNYWRACRDRWKEARAILRDPTASASLRAIARRALALISTKLNARTVK